jgi:hypothetical protein
MGLLATTNLEVVPFRPFHRFQRFCHFLNTSWKSCSIRMFGRLQFCLDHLSYVKMAAFQGGWRTTVMLFLVKSSMVKMEV